MHSKSITLRTLLPVLLSMTCLTPVYGQSLIDPSSAPAAAKTVSNRMAPENISAKSLVPFQESSDMLTLSGEDDGVELNFSVTSAQIAAGGTVQIGYQNAVSVLPDQSVMDVELNGKVLGSFPIRSPNGVAIEKLPVVASDLKPGRNRLFIRARQVHRVDCSLEATYELWTKMDARVSGFATPVAADFTSVEQLPGIAKTAQGKTDFRIVLPADITAQALNDALPLVQIMALYLNRSDIQVSIAGEPGTGPGIDFYIGSNQSGMPAEKGMEALNTAPIGMTVQSGATPDRAVVFLKAASSEDLRNELLKQVRGTMAAGFKTGVFASTFGKTLAESGKTFTLAQTGYRTKPFTGHLSHTHFKLEMPADFYPGDYANMDMELHAATSPGLDPNSQLLVRINDKVVTSYPFRNKDGQQFNGKRVSMPLRAFHPGVNTVDILAEVPKAADAACVTDSHSDAKPRFLLLENTSISVPELARVARLPDLAAFSGKAYPFRNGKPFNLYLDHPDATNLSAAFTLLTRLSLASGNPLNAKFNLSAPDPTIEGDIIVMNSEKPVEPDNGPKNGFSGDLSIDQTKTSAISGLDGISSDANAGPNPEDLLQAFTQTTADQGSSETAGLDISHLWNTSLGRFAKWLRYEDGTRQPSFSSAGSNLVTLSQILSPSGVGTWTVVNAGSSADLAEGTNRLTDAPVWTALNGGSAIIHTADNSLETIPAATRYVSEFTDLSFSNNRRLAAAWLSDNFQIYVLIVLGLMGVFAVWLGQYVPGKGVRTDQ